MDFVNHLNDFICSIEQDSIKGHEVHEVVVGKSLFLYIISDIKCHENMKQGDLFKGYQELPEWVKLATPFGYVKVSWREE